MRRGDLDRRGFLKGAAAALSLVGLSGCASFSRVPWTGYCRPRDIGVYEKLNIAAIGVGGQGLVDLEGVSSENIVALCDVDWERAREACQRFPKARRFWDYRTMLREMGDRIDAVTISTPDHTHFPAAKLAIEMGKHVYCQKPLTQTVWEARELRRLAWRHRVSTQMGNQGHANNGTRVLREWVQAGLVGPVDEVHVWTDRPLWRQGMERPAGSDPVPRTLEWDLWLGTAPARPYVEGAYCPFKWRGWWDFGTGALGDMGCHLLDAPFWALDIVEVFRKGGIVKVEAETSGVNAESAPSWEIVRYEIPARSADLPALTLTWYSGGRKPARPRDLESERALSASGQLIVGRRGTIYDTSDACESPRLIPEAKMRESGALDIPRTLSRVQGGSYQEWIRSCKGSRPVAGSNFVDYSSYLTEFVLLGNVAIRVGKKIEYDTARGEALNCPEAQQFLKRPYRRVARVVEGEKTGLRD
jgi:predicted dehydrogenase